jgi:hypothetical protein
LLPSSTGAGLNAGTRSTTGGMIPDGTDESNSKISRFFFGRALWVCLWLGAWISSILGLSAMSRSLKGRGTVLKLSYAILGEAISDTIGDDGEWARTTTEAMLDAD